MKTRLTKAAYVEWLNELPVPTEDLKSEGGRIPDDAKLGDWMRRNDLIAFNVGFNEWVREEMHARRDYGRTTVDPQGFESVETP